MIDPGEGDHTCHCVTPQVGAEGDHYIGGALEWRDYPPDLDPRIVISGPHVIPKTILRKQGSVVSDGGDRLKVIVVDRDPDEHEAL